ncbi:MAG: hotdog fold thioesterase [Xanthomonadales bacterium]|nr:hotdog fold thioesterase [Xanthomonadales bacterium]
MPLWKRQLDLEELRRWQRGTLDETLGIEILEIGEDFVRGRMPVDGRTRQPFGLLHGGASVALAESLGSLAANLCLEPGSSIAVGLDINANHLRPVTRGYVTGTARSLHLGRSTQVWEIRIEDEEGRLCCVARLTLAVTAKQ